MLAVYVACVTAVLLYCALLPLVCCCLCCGLLSTTLLCTNVVTYVLEKWFLHTSVMPSTLFAWTDDDEDFLLL